MSKSINRGTIWKVFIVLYLLNTTLNLISGLALLLMVDVLNTYRFLNVPLPRYLVIIFSALLLYFGYWELRSLFRKKIHDKNFLFISLVTLLFAFIILFSLFIAEYVPLSFWTVFAVGVFLLVSGVIFLVFYRIVFYKLEIDGDSNG